METNPFKVGDKVVYTSFSAGYGLTPEMNLWRQQKTILTVTEVDGNRVRANDKLKYDGGYNFGWSFNWKELEYADKIKKLKKIKPWQL